MNYFTIKKVVALSLLGVLGITAANAQDASTSSAKVFGGRSQYRTWSLGVNAGVVAPIVVIGGANDFRYWDASLGYGLTLRKQFGHVFGLEFSTLRSEHVKGNNNSGENARETTADAAYIATTDRISFDTQLGWTLVASPYVNIGSIDFLKRENSVNFFVKAGGGIAWYAPSFVHQNNVVEDWKGKAGGGSTNDHNSKKYVKELIIPVGFGAKFKVSDRINFDLGYTMNFVDGDNFDGTYAKSPSHDKFSYASAGLEFSLGSSSKPNIDWVNPIALAYDELKDPSLRQELEALKGRVNTLEATVNTLSADADGDGVANRFDKCPGTPAGTQVDGSGCPIKFPEPPPATTVVPQPTNQNIQFDFDSAVLKTSAYPILDQQAAYLKANSSVTIELDGYASSEGTEAYNLKLSLDRANAVKTYLVNSGVNANNITVKGLGESNPIASNATEEGRILNRRVEFKR